MKRRIRKGIGIVANLAVAIVIIGFEIVAVVVVEMVVIVGLLIFILNNALLISEISRSFSNTNICMQRYTIYWGIEMVFVIIFFIIILCNAKKRHKKKIEEMKQEKKKFSSKCFSLEEEICTLNNEIWKLKEERDALKRKLDNQN